MDLNRLLSLCCPLFSGISANEISAILKSLNAKKRTYPKNTFVVSVNDPVSSIGIVTSGSVNVIKEDFWGNRMILARLEKGDLFGEAFFCAQLPFYPVSVIAAEDCDILFLNYLKLTEPSAALGNSPTKLMQNMLQILAGKNVLLTQKIEHITRRTTREKLLSYLSSQALQAQSQSFKVPFNRQELADYLAVDRSAMSNELSKLREEGLLRFHKSSFELVELKD